MTSLLNWIADLRRAILTGHLVDMSKNADALFRRVGKHQLVPQVGYLGEVFPS